MLQSYDVLCHGSQHVLLQFVRTIARCPESSVRCPSVREGEKRGVGFVHSSILSVLAVMGDCKIQREGNVMSFCTVKFFTLPKPLCIILLQASPGLKRYYLEIRVHQCS